MAGKGRYLLIVSMDVDPEKEALFNEVYDTEHVPALGHVPGVLAARRFRRQDETTLFVGGERRTSRSDDLPRYVALYELESPDVLTSQAFCAVVDEGRWATEVRPYTRNRRHVLYEASGSER